MALQALALKGHQRKYELGGHPTMKRMILAATLALAVLGAAGPTAAADVEGKIKSVEVNQRVLTLEDGTQLYWTESVTVTEAVKSGALVRATYEDQGGQFVLTSLEVLE
jgi:hypothetical protein